MSDDNTQIQAAQADVRQLYEGFRSQLDAMTQEAWERYGSQMACRVGCHQCCRGDFKISLIEANSLKQAFKKLPESKKRHIERQLQDLSPERCPLLDSEGACSVYADRPTLCRIFGFPIRLPETESQEEHITTCELNFQDSQQQAFSAKCFDQKAIQDVLEQLSRLFFVASGNQAPETAYLPRFTVAEVLLAGAST
ncbi:MAG: YkgJ family cysteine cluster protein [Vampirovibrionales bacterium]|nr:YkgJ family cysteine cluster protein [Vampirovibrionales bacterium]